MSKTKTPDAVDSHVGARIRMRRMMLGMSQEKLGDALGITFQQIQKEERGANRVSAGRLFKMAKVLQVPVSFFFDGQAPFGGKAMQLETTVSPSIVADFLATRDGLDLTVAFMAIKDVKKRKAIVNLVEQMS